MAFDLTQRAFDNLRDERPITRMLKDAKAEGLTFHVSCEGVCDYAGRDVGDAIEALEACDEMELRVIRDANVEGWALFILDLEDDEQLADAAGWCDEWLVKDYHS